MAYHPLTNDTGGDENARIAEAHKICQILEEYVDQMNDREQGLLEQMTDCDYCSPKQLFWLRDIKDKYV